MLLRRVRNGHAAKPRSTHTPSLPLLTISHCLPPSSQMQKLCLFSVHGRSKARCVCVCVCMVLVHACICTSGFSISSKNARPHHVQRLSSNPSHGECRTWKVCVRVFACVWIGRYGEVEFRQTFTSYPEDCPSNGARRKGLGFLTTSCLVAAERCQQ